MTTLTLIYTGQRLPNPAAPKLLARYLEEETKQERWYAINPALRRFMMGTVGTVYEVPVDEEDGRSILLGQAKRLRLSSVGDVARWRAEQSDDVATLANRKPLPDSVVAALKPLRGHYRTLPSPARAQMLARIVAYLERSSG